MPPTGQLNIINLVFNVNTVIILLHTNTHYIKIMHDIYNKIMIILHQHYNDLIVVNFRTVEGNSAGSGEDAEDGWNRPEDDKRRVY